MSNNTMRVQVRMQVFGKKSLVDDFSLTMTQEKATRFQRALEMAGLEATIAKGMTDSACIQLSVKGVRLVAGVTA